MHDELSKGPDHASYRPLDMARYPHFGQMNDPLAVSYTKGLCGDEIEFYVDITQGRVEEVRFYTENGCEHTYICGETVCRLATGNTIRDALRINPGQVIDEYFGEDREGWHCAILAVMTFHKAIARYLLMR